LGSAAFIHSRVGTVPDVHIQVDALDLQLQNPGIFERPVTELARLMLSRRSQWLFFIR
jgi:hypothetical protein